LGNLHGWRTWLDELALANFHWAKDHNAKKSSQRVEYPLVTVCIIVLLIQVIPFIFPWDILTPMCNLFYIPVTLMSRQDHPCSFIPISFGAWYTPSADHLHLWLTTLTTFSFLILPSSMKRAGVLLINSWVLILFWIGKVITGLLPNSNPEHLAFHQTTMSDMLFVIYCQRCTLSSIFTKCIPTFQRFTSTNFVHWYFNWIVVIYVMVWQ